MPVGTQATVKAITAQELVELRAQIVLCNAYHLHLRPGERLISRAGGLHHFMNWHRPLLTDSGGYQVFSLEGLARLDDDGILFHSHLDGTKRRFTPESVMAIQEALGADIAVTLDEPVPYPSDAEAARIATERSEAWAERCLAAHSRSDQLLFGIVQGGFSPEHRVASAGRVGQMGFDGHCIGGLSVGEPRDLTWELVEATCEPLPADRPRYLMGVGAPEEIVQAVSLGADMFDCVLPTRLGRNGCAFTTRGRLNLKSAEFAEDFRALDESCPCRSCAGYSRAYVRHLYKAKEILAAQLVTYHNLHFYLTTMRRIREAIVAGTFADLQRHARESGGCKWTNWYA